MSPSSSISHSQLLARALRGCWRTTPPPSEIDAAAWPKITQLLIGSGAGALAWRGVRHGAQHDLPAVAALRETHHAQALHAMLQEREIAAIFTRLQQNGVAAILLKGWANARLYPEIGLRPFGDIDVLVKPEQKLLASQVLQVPIDDKSETHCYFIDAKSQLHSNYGFDTAQVWQNIQTTTLHGAPIPLLSAEDQLRMLCLHFLRHGAWRPLWLCDIAVALEARPDEFDWERCLSRDRHRADAIACALGLAHQLLDARIDDTPVAARAGALPSWLVPAVLEQWKTPLLSQHGIPTPTLKLVRHSQTWRALAQRWPDPIQAMLLTRCPLDWPPLPAQIARFTVLMLTFLKRAPGKVRRAIREAA